VGTLGGTPELGGRGAGAGRALRGAEGPAQPPSSSVSPSRGEAARRAEHICQLIVCAERRTKRKATEKMQNAFKNTLSFPFLPEAEVLK